MKKNRIIAFLMAFNVMVNAQINLVPNPSFEDTVSAPLGGVIEDATGWINCGNTPDYYNAGFDSDGFGFGVPNCFFTGYQNAFHGNAFAGIGLTAIPEQPAEFISIQLSQPLTIGTKYYVSGYISRADDYRCSTNNFCFRFFNSMYFSAGSPPPFDNIAHIRSATINSDSLNWNFVGGSFIADSAYQYIVMGNFFNLSQTDTLHCTASDASYYYIDAICVSSDSATCMLPTSIQQYSVKQTGLYVYPNPSNNYIQLKNLTVSTSYLLINRLGQVCMYGKLTPNDSKMDVSSLASGLYFLKTDMCSLKIIINHP